MQPISRGPEHSLTLSFDVTPNTDLPSFMGATFCTKGYHQNKREPQYIILSCRHIPCTHHTWPYVRVSTDILPHPKYKNWGITIQVLSLMKLIIPNFWQLYHNFFFFYKVLTSTRVTKFYKMNSCSTKTTKETQEKRHHTANIFS